MLPALGNIPLKILPPRGLHPLPKAGAVSEFVSRVGKIEWQGTLKGRT